jgi:hypothetical protein
MNCQSNKDLLKKGDQVKKSERCGHVALMGERFYRVLVRKPERKTKWKT